VAGGAAAFEAARYLVERGVDINAQSNNGNTALMMAAQTGQKDTVEFLLGKGADARRKAKDGQTALSLSLKRGDAGMAARFREAGANE
jgi:ankyrin repeat protein